MTGDLMLNNSNLEFFETEQLNLTIDND